MKSIWDFQKSISRRLLFWSGLSVLSGAIMILPGNPFWRGFGIQSVAWGAVDAAIALIGWHKARRKIGISHTNDLLAKEARKLRLILWVNTGLDVLYVTGGILLASIHQNIFWRGHGWGIIIQGGFLFFFDLVHARSVPPGESNNAPEVDVAKHEPVD